MILNLKQEIKADKKRLKKIDRELKKLVDLALSGTLSKETISGKELIQSKLRIESQLQENEIKLRTLPDIKETQKEAEKVRRSLLEKSNGKDRLENMTFERK